MNIQEQNVHNVFFSVMSEYRLSMEQSIKDIWEVGDEDMTIIILSFLHYLMRNGCKLLNEMYESCKKNISFQILLLSYLGCFLSARQQYKDQRQVIYNILIEGGQPRSTGRVLRNKGELNRYLWGQAGERYDKEINKVTVSLKNFLSLPELFDFQYVKEELRKALCIHPEMVLSGYDFDGTLDNWRDRTVQRIIGQIADIQIIKCLEKRDPLIVEKVFYSIHSGYRVGIELGIRESWKLSEKEDIFPIVMTFVYNLLVRDKGAELKRLKKCIVRDVPYFPLPVQSDLYRPQKWTRYEDGTFLILLKDYARNYAEGRSVFKEERVKLKTLFYLPEKERNLLWADYEKGIYKAIKKISTSFYSQLEQDEIIKKRIKDNLKELLCSDAFEALLSKYDFKYEFSQWYKTFIKNIIEDFIMIQCLMDVKEEANILKILKKNHEGFILDKAGSKGIYSPEQAVNDLLYDLYITLMDRDKKVLKDFQFNARLISYINAIALHLIDKKVKIQAKTQPFSEDDIKDQEHEPGELGEPGEPGEPDEPCEWGEPESEPNDNRTKKNTNQGQKSFFGISIAEISKFGFSLKEISEFGLSLEFLSKYFEIYNTLLAKPEYRECCGIRRKIGPVQELQFRIVRELYVDLGGEFTIEMQKKKKKTLLQEFKTEPNGENYLSQNKKRAIANMIKMAVMINRIESTPDNQRNEQQKSLLKDYYELRRQILNR